MNRPPPYSLQINIYIINYWICITSQGECLILGHNSGLVSTSTLTHAASFRLLTTMQFVHLWLVNGLHGPSGPGKDAARQLCKLSSQVRKKKTREYAEKTRGFSGEWRQRHNAKKKGRLIRLRLMFPLLSLSGCEGMQIKRPSGSSQVSEWRPDMTCVYTGTAS